MEKETRAGRKVRSAANDNSGKAVEPIDPRIIRIAEAIGRKLARDHIQRMRTANDNQPGGLDGTPESEP